MKHVLYGVFTFLIMNGIPNVASQATAQESQPVVWKLLGTVYGVQMYSFKTHGMGWDIIRWKLTNTNSFNVNCKFSKTYTASTGMVKTVDAIGVDLKPGASASGNVFAGDLDLCDYPFDPGVKITHWNMNLSVKNVDEEARLAQERQDQIKQLEKRDEQLAVQKRKEEEAKRQAEERERQQEELLREQERQKRAEMERRMKEAAEREKTGQAQVDNTVKDFSDLSGAIVKGPHGTFNGDTWYVAFGGGLWMGSIPVIESHSGSGINSYSAPSGALGIGGMLTLEVWPYYGRNIGIGAFGNFAYGAATGGNFGGSVFSGNYGGKGFLGFEAIRAVGEISMGPRSGVTTSDNANIGIDAQGVGSGSYKLNRLGYGIAFKIDEHAYIELMKFDDKPDYLAPAQKLPTVWHAALIWPGGMYGYMEYGNKYPAAGTAVFPLQDADKGEVITFGMCFLLGAFGEPFF
jgi:hypothetical protein